MECVIIFWSILLDINQEKQKHILKDSVICVLYIKPRSLNISRWGTSSPLFILGQGGSFGLRVMAIDMA